MAKRRGGRERTNSPPSGPTLIVIGVVVVAAILVGAGTLLGGDPSAAPTTEASLSPATTSTATLEPEAATTASPTTTAVRCDATEQLTFHVHVHLSIRADGQVYLPPANLGITPACFYWLHTHADSGILHVEAPVEADYTLGQFFEIWGEPLTPTQVADHRVGPSHSLYVFIGGHRQDGADPRTIVLRNLEAIELQIGTAPLDPLPYTFPPGF